jgi:putative addiction module component (TIGR02574 family)
MNPTLRDLPLQQRVQLVEDLWDSIAQDQQALPVTDAQRAELDRRLDGYEQDGNQGRDATTVLNEIRQKL